MVESQFVKFKVDYSKTKKHGIGEAVSVSNAISVGGRIWSLCCHPGGITPPELSGYGAYLSLSVVTLGNPKNAAVDVKAIFTAMPIGIDGAPSSFRAKCTSHVILTPNDAAFMGLCDFIKRRDVESNYLINGCVTFLCGIVALDDDRISAVPAASDLGSHLGSLLDLEGSSDVSFLVGGETFRAHRAVLAARSPVFRAQLFGGMADAKMDLITLHDVMPAAFRILLRFMYTDDGSAIDRSLSTELLQDLLAAADMYHVDRLKFMCAQELWDRVTVENVAATLGCADRHCPELKKKCMDFVMVDKNFKKVALTKGYMQLMQNFPSVIDEMRARAG